MVSVYKLREKANQLMAHRRRAPECMSVNRRHIALGISQIVQVMILIQDTGMINKA